MVLKGFGAAYFGGGVQWGNSTQWVGKFVINDHATIQSNVMRYACALQSFMSAKGLKPATVLNSCYSSSFNQRHYNLVFNQTGTCSNPTSYVSPWAVTLDNRTTVSEPPNAIVPTYASSWERDPDNLPSISISVPDGTYTYVVYPLNVFGETGTVTVNGG